MPAQTRTSLARHKLQMQPRIPGIKIGLLGGSFDPPHEGHLHLSKQGIQRLGLDQVWWLVSSQNPLKQRKPVHPDLRVATCQAFVSHPCIRVTDLEIRIGSTHTIETIEYLTRTLPLVRFVWMMGSDNLATFDLWKRWREIVHLLPIAVFPRPRFRSNIMNCPAARYMAKHRLRTDEARLLASINAPAWCELSIPLHYSSSTKIRNRGEWPV